MSDFGM
jgi:hypothetical protein